VAWVMYARTTRVRVQPTSHCVYREHVCAWTIMFQTKDYVVSFCSKTNVKPELNGSNLRSN